MGERVSVRRGWRPSRREDVVARGPVGHALAALAVAAFALQAGCDGWPPGDRNSPPTGGGIVNMNGTCSGTPVPCALLVGAQCRSSSGCIDNGSCIGTATVAGQSCATSSPTDCASTPGCFWSGTCSGTPIGTCTAYIESTCTATVGCVWTPTPLGYGGSAGLCQSYLTPCNSSATCDCGLACVSQCSGCGSVCATACTFDAQCTGTTGRGTPTPYCQVLQAGASGICAATH